MESVAITGLGALTPIGSDLPSFTAALDAGRIGITAAPWADPETGRFAWVADVEDFDGLRYLDERTIGGTDLFTQYAMAAAIEAVEDFGDELDPFRTAVVIGVNQGGARALLEAQRLHDVEGPQSVPRKLTLQFPHNMPAAQITMRWKLHGPSLTITTACASSLDAIGVAAGMIESGRVDVAIVGGTERALCETLYISQERYGMSKPVADPTRASLPFDVDRIGIVEGAGAGIIVLESATRAAARHATIHGYVAGYGSISDSYHPSSPDPSGVWEARAMRLALEDAHLDPDAVGAVVAHGTATPLGDLAEIAAINDVYCGRHDLAVTSIKGHVGHTGATAGVLNVITGLHAFRTGRLANTAGTTNVEPSALFNVVVDKPADVALEAFQANAFGFGGQNASIVVRRG